MYADVFNEKYISLLLTIKYSETIPNTQLYLKFSKYTYLENNNTIT